MDPIGAETVTESGSDWAQRARLVFRPRCDWADLGSLRPQAVPRTRCMLKGCAQPVFALEGLSLPGCSVWLLEQPRGLCFLFQKKANIFRRSRAGYVTRPGVGLSRNRSFLVFLFHLLYETRKLVEDNGLPGIQRRCGRGGERRRRRRWCCSCQNQRTGRYTQLSHSFLLKKRSCIKSCWISHAKTWFASYLSDPEFIMIRMWRHFGAS